MEKNREIKFRAWSIETGIMSEPFSLLNALKRECVDTPHWEKGILMQFTGLLDKNGKEIYEGDVVKCDPDEPQRFDYNNPYEVKKSADGVSWNFGNNWFSWIYDIDTKKMACKIIGNIYENPELLTNK